MLDNEMKEMHKKEYIALSGLYSLMLMQFLNPLLGSNSPTKPIECPESTSFPNHDYEINGKNLERSAG